MDLALSDDEVVTLRGLLEDFLPGLRFEVARSKAAEIRHALAKRQALCDRLLDQLREAARPGSANSAAT